MPRTRTLVVAGVVAVLAVGAAVPAGLAWRDRRDEQRLRQAAESFASAWQAGSLETVAWSGAPGQDVAARVKAVTAGLTPAAQDRPAAVELTSVSAPAGDRATGALHVRWQLGQGRTWEYDTSAPLVRADGGWQVEWSPAVVHPRLVEGQVLTTSRVRAERGQIRGARDEVLVTERQVVMVGIQPGRTTDRRATAAAVAALVEVDAAELTKRVLAAGANAFVDVITLRRDAYARVRARLQPIPGTVFRESTLSLGPTAGFARALLGTAGQATKEIVAASKGRVLAGDITGLSGVQRSFDEKLSGTAGVTVTAGPPAAGSAATKGSTGTDPAAGAGGTVPTTQLYTVDPVPGENVQLSLDSSVQIAAESALTAAKLPAALVAVRPSTGEVLAVANGGPNADGYNRALIGQYAPGSTFKIVTTFALLQGGLTTDTPVPCPPTINVGGRVFKNAEDEVLGTVPFHTDFAQSCNTAFIGASRQITAGQLSDAATALGYGATSTLGVDAFAGSVPRTANQVEHAADSIGQGKVLASPLTVATVSASVAAGRRVSPRLVLTDAAPSEPEALPADVARQLQGLTAEVVTSGTGSALRSVPGEPVHGKTGTAEFGSADPPETHAWFTGYQGDVAFAVIVDGGGFGGVVAAPLAARFLTALG